MRKLEPDGFSLDVGARLRAARLAAGLSLRGLRGVMAERGAPWSLGMLHRAEMGQAELRVRMLCAWAGACGTTPWDLLRLPPVGPQGSGPQPSAGVGLRRLDIESVSSGVDSRQDGR